MLIGAHPCSQHSASTSKSNIINPGPKPICSHSLLKILLWIFIIIQLLWFAAITPTLNIHSPRLSLSIENGIQTHTK